MPRKSREVRAGLQRKGFAASDGDHVFLTYVTTDGLLTTVMTKVSHGGSHDIGDALLAQMARQCKLPKRKFLDLVDCPLAQTDYEAELRKQGTIT